MSKIVFKNSENEEVEAKTTQILDLNSGTYIRLWIGTLSLYAALDSTLKFDDILYYITDVAE